MPLDDYDIFATWDDQETLGRAKYIAEGKCMEPQGFTFRAAHLVDSPDSSVGDRPYGIWDEDAARNWGFDAAPETTRPAIEEDADKGGKTWLAALTKCDAHLDPAIAGVYPTNKELTDSLVSRLRTEAFNEASDNPRWQQARENWWGCLTKAGLTPRTGASEWGTQQDASIEVDSTGKPIDQAAAIKVAYTEAKCNVDTGMAQTLGDLEASYQAPLIDKNQAALNKLKADKQSRLQRARAYIAANG